MVHAKRLLVIGTESHFGAGVVKGIHGYCRAHGEWEYHMEADNSPECAKAARLAIREWKAHGIIGHVHNARIERLMRDCGLPAVNVGGGRAWDLPTVKTDNFNLGRLGAQYFLEIGFKHFAYYARAPELYTRERCAGYCLELMKTGLRCKIFEDRREVSWGRQRQRLSRWLSSLAKPVAVFCVYDQRAQEVAVMCRRQGLRVPDDVAIMGCSNNEPVCEMCTPPLSSVQLDAERVGYEAAKLLDHIMKADGLPAKPLLVPPLRIVTRQSSDVVAVEDADVAAVMRFIRLRGHEPISVKDILHAVPISRRVLEQRFKKLMNRTLKEEILRIRMERARGLLSDTEMMIPAVAERSGFVSRESFARCFTRETGLSPGRFRQKCRLK